jgi:hypothetical protein
MQSHCDICGRKTYLTRDRNKNTGAPRGVLCTTCRLAVRYMRENPGLCRAAAEYLDIYAAAPKPLRTGRMLRTIDGL